MSSLEIWIVSSDATRELEARSLNDCTDGLARNSCRQRRKDGGCDTRHSQAWRSNIQSQMYIGPRLIVLHDVE